MNNMKFKLSTYIMAGVLILNFLLAFFGWLIFLA